MKARTVAVLVVWGVITVVLGLTRWNWLAGG